MIDLEEYKNRVQIGDWAMSYDDCVDRDGRPGIRSDLTRSSSRCRWYHNNNNNNNMYGRRGLCGNGVKSFSEPATIARSSSRRVFIPS